jgi:hypothetical protein
MSILCITGVDHNRIYAPYLTVYSVICLPKIPCIHRVYIWFWPTLCITGYSLDFSSVFLVWLQAFFQVSAQMPTRGIYSDVTLPYLLGTHTARNTNFCKATYTADTNFCKATYTADTPLHAEIWVRVAGIVCDTYVVFVGMARMVLHSVYCCTIGEFPAQNTRWERLTPQMGVFFKCSQSMRAYVCYSQTWLQMVAHATAAGQLSFIVANVGPYA